MPMRIGFGIDIHRYCDGDHVMLGGIRIPSPIGIQAHSDGDVVLHALCDALLGAAALGDIGEHFPDTDPRWKDTASSAFVEYTIALLQQQQLQVVNLDISIVAEQPKISPYKRAIRERIAELCSVSPEVVSIKATTSEKIGFVGRQEGIVAFCVCLLDELR
ncbi:MAG: 2-C-methyl-D-erythritol 2,4-cyclodiphosphate synthase [Bacteroidota bacterium]|nr:2-C-methyl-D-erythritol 2,4-cyclodiphosphate synthase [Candidatus Kapabacteria bacterium]MCS7303025.1 2-C-methyl-D-erythritol 2,4-cyclodiphosphate synthase [Candidatus Kapabacteria bacterium]MDW8074709.1 2-C-methyl-D-erythritol 2,4-cyclodiphosphate synthase [Bacteroidota bacterium]MDW8270815.1 2-C-methyl-D-erythritol 2,4-cyclodiphosphate synthase [Bacteroidota bacterium]